MGYERIYVRKIRLTQDKQALVDDEDYERVNQYKWHYTNRGYAMNRGRRVNGKQTNSIYMHRLIMNPPNTLYVDHKNGDKLDNRKKNLRICTASQNQANRVLGKNSTNGYKGVYKVNRDTNIIHPWRAAIKQNNRWIWLGNYSTVKQAALAYNKAAKKYKGSFALLNDI